MFTTELQYIVVRYMLNELADEAVNVGMIGVTDDPPRIMMRFLPDPTVKSRSDARVKSDVVERFVSVVTAALDDIATHPPKDAALSTMLFARLRELGGNIVRTNLPRSALTNNVDQEFELLFTQWVAPTTVPHGPRSYAPRDPLRGLRKEASRALVQAFRQGYGHSLSRKTFVRQHEVQGVVHRSTFDLAMLSRTKKGRREHLFQHLLMLPDAEESFTQTAALCWRWADVRARNGADRHLTAVLYERGDERTRGVPDATHLLKREQIDFAHLKELPEFVRKLQGQGELL
jgi:hypothetical protein